MRSHLLLVAALLVGQSALTAAVIGTNPPSSPLTAARIAALPADQRPAWQAYFERSRRLSDADLASFNAELKAAGLTTPLRPPNGHPPSLRRPAAWWSSVEAATIADNLVTFQPPSGGWNKNTNMTAAPRRRGERYGYEIGYFGTIDNDATITEIRFLAKVITANSSAPHAAAWLNSFGRGVECLLASQYPNGGWPQVFPLVGGYHDAVTFNDSAMTNVLSFLHDLSTGGNEFAFVGADLRVRTAAAVERGLACLLAAQITVDGRRTVWCQQYDMLTLQPCAARNYEMPSQASAESADLVLFLMRLPVPSAAVVSEVHTAAAWFQKTQLRDVAFPSVTDGSGRKLVRSPGAAPLWPRYSEIGTDRPLFGDRDHTIHDTIDEISRERRDGYAWYGTWPARALEQYAKWAKAHPKS